MENNALKLEVTLNNIDYLLNEWKFHPQRKGACRDLMTIRTHLIVQADTGRIPLLEMRRETWVDRLKGLRLEEWATALAIFAAPFWMDDVLREMIKVGQIIQEFLNGFGI